MAKRRDHGGRLNNNKNTTSYVAIKCICYYARTRSNYYSFMNTTLGEYYLKISLLHTKTAQQAHIIGLRREKAS